MGRYKVTSFYYFLQIPKDSLIGYKDSLIAKYGETLRGLFLISPEGFNATLCGNPEVIDEFKISLPDFFQIPLNEIIFKDSETDFRPFRRFKIDIRNEVITYNGFCNPKPSKKSFLSPKAWHETINNDKDCIIIDTRNVYETSIGKFKGAIDPNIRTFGEFQEYVRKTDLPRDKKILTYCTGGVRCEKVVADMEQLGFDNVYHLHGGILKYLEEYPNQLYEGECFIFDHRVSVQQDLSPTQIYNLCPHCGDPGKEKIACHVCGNEVVVCQECVKKGKISCSKNCQYHLVKKKTIKQANNSDFKS